MANPNKRELKGGAVAGVKRVGGGLAVILGRGLELISSLSHALAIQPYYAWGSLPGPRVDRQPPKAAGPA